MTRDPQPPNLTTDPTPENRVQARTVLETHLRVTVPEVVCNRCLRHWPCPQVQWATTVTRRAGIEAIPGE